MAAQQRDAEAEQRDREADASDGAAGAADRALEVRAAGDRRDAAEDRTRAADARAEAAYDRQGAAHDRALAAHHLADVERVARLGSWEWFTDRDEMIWTNGLYRVFGLEPQACEATYAALLERFHPEDRPMVESMIRRSFGIHEPFKYQARVLQPDGETVRVQAYGDVALGPGDRVLRVSGTVMDITERQSAATGAEQTRLEADLYRTQRLDSLGQLASGIAHDFNNILVVVQS